MAVWRDYCHKKIILANKVPIKEDVLVEYIIDGIPVKSIQNQAIIQEFSDKESLIKAMENVTLGSEQKTLYKSNKVSGARHAKVGLARKVESDVGGKQEPKCFNCNKLGHIVIKCPKPRRERGACFKCLQQGHRAKDCTRQKGQCQRRVQRETGRFLSRSRLLSSKHRK